MSIITKFNEGNAEHIRGGGGGGGRISVPAISQEKTGTTASGNDRNALLNFSAAFADKYGIREGLGVDVVADRSQFPPVIRLTLHEDDNATPRKVANKTKKEDMDEGKSPAYYVGFKGVLSELGIEVNNTHLVEFEVDESGDLPVIYMQHDAEQVENVS